MFDSEQSRIPARIPRDENEYVGRNLLVDDAPPYTGKVNFKLYDFILVHKHGYLITHEGTTEFKVDRHLISGFISALSLFSQEIFEEEHPLRIIDFGKRKILCESGRYLTIGAIVDRAVPSFQQKLKSIMSKVENRYERILRRWKGNPDSVEPIVEVFLYHLREYMISPITFLPSRFRLVNAPSKYLFTLAGEAKEMEIDNASLGFRVFLESNQLNEEDFDLLMSSLKRDVLNFQELEVIMNLDPDSLISILRYLVRREIIQIYSYATKRRFKVQSGPMVASSKDYVADIQSIKKMGKEAFIGLEVKVDSSKIRESPVLIPILLAVASSEGLVIPHLIKKTDRIRSIIAQELLQRQFDPKYVKKLNVLQTLEKIEDIW
ncbi:MAG: hypothetical protein ACFE7E_07375 [Candidatus Hodarchaeota archaeon]